MGRACLPGKQLNALFALLFILASFASPAALAADENTPAPVKLVVTSFTCVSDPGNVSLLMGTIPASCTPAAGVSMSIKSDLDAPVSGTTLGNGAFETTISIGANITVWQDTALLTGAVPRMNPINTYVSDVTEVTFINLPIVTPAPTDIPAPQPTAVPPTAVPPTAVPPTAVPPTEVPPTEQPPVKPASRTLQTTESTIEKQDVSTSETSSLEVTGTSTATATATSTATTTANTAAIQAPTPATCPS